MLIFDKKNIEGLRVMVQVPMNLASNLGGIIKAVEKTEAEHEICFEQIEVRFV